MESTGVVIRAVTLPERTDCNVCQRVLVFWKWGQ